MHPAVGAALSAGLVALDSGLLCRETVPSGALVSLRNRRSDIEAALVGAPRKVIASVLASLGGMPTQSIPNNDEVAALTRQDVDDLSDVSAWALEDAARAFRRGEIGDGKWRPTAGQVRKEARRRENEARAELYSIHRLLDAPALSAPRPSYIPKAEVEALHKRIGFLATEKVA